MKKLLFVFAIILSIPAWAAVPDGYKQLQYIQLASDKRIQSGFTPDADYKHTIVFEAVSVPDGGSYITGTQNPRSGNVKLLDDTKMTIYVNDLSNGGALAIVENAPYLSNAKNTLVMDLRQNQTSYVYLNGDKVSNDAKGSITSTNQLAIGTNGTTYSAGMSVRIYSDTIEQGGQVIHNFIPVQRNSDSAIGMYDLILNEFVAATGNGEVVAGPEGGVCGNAFDGMVNTAEGGKAQNVNPIYLIPGQKYIADWSASSGIGGINVFLYNAAGTLIASYDTSATIENSPFSDGIGAWQRRTLFTVPNNGAYITFTTFGNTTVARQQDFAQTLQIKPKSCTTIEIATTKHVAAAFSGVNSQLAAAITTVNSVVTATIEQATRIADLATGKQTRPADGTECPQYRQCLLVEDESGVPHWYEINDPFYNFFQPILANGTNGASSTNDPGYQQLEYIESTGTQYIDTGIQNLSIETEIESKLEAQSGSVIWGNCGYDTPGCIYFLLATNSGPSYFGNIYEGETVKYTLGMTGSLGMVYTVRQNKNAIFVNGTQKIAISSPANSVSNPNSFVIFGAPSGNYNRATARIYYFKIHDNGVLRFNGIPVRRNSDSAIGMYDTVTKTFFANAGTGTFTAGPNVPNSGDVPANPTWNTTWDANANGVVAGTVYGEGLCNAVSGTYGVAATSAQLSSSNWNTFDANCWCKITGLTVDGEYSAAPSSASWVFRRTLSSAAHCASGCAVDCASNVRGNAGFRSAMFGSVK